MAAGALGGRRVYVQPHPAGRRPRLGDPLARDIGAEAAATLARLFGAGPLLIPLGPIRAAANRSAEIHRMLDGGATVPQVVKALRRHERTVFRHKVRRGRESTGQGRLF